MIELNREQIKRVCSEEAKYQLTIMRQYLCEEEFKFYLELLKKNTTMFDFSTFCIDNKLEGLINEFD